MRATEFNTMFDSILDAMSSLMLDTILDAVFNTRLGIGDLDQVGWMLS